MNIKDEMYCWFDLSYDNGNYVDKPDNCFEYIKDTEWDEFLVMEFNNYAAAGKKDYNFIGIDECKSICNQILRKYYLQEWLTSLNK